MFLLGKDLNSFNEIAKGLLDGNPRDCACPARGTPQTRERLARCIKLYEETRAQAGAILGNLQGLVSAREAQDAIIADSEPLRKGLESVQDGLGTETGFGGLHAGRCCCSARSSSSSAAPGSCACTCADQAPARQRWPKRSASKPKRQEQEAKRVNDANQAAILATDERTADGRRRRPDAAGDGDRGHHRRDRRLGELHGRGAAHAGGAGAGHGRPGDRRRPQQVEATSTELLAASTEQLREIRETGESVLQMAGRINDVSAQAQETAQVARQSLQAAESGLQAVQNTIGGMNSIRDQIQETSKRIKRLGESSQEIGEITELISDITEQTNVLALNAAIQAASAGEAGRGFSVVAEEVQRLAERSADATRQIAALVKTIQTDTQDAVGAMERSTQGVVEGARLSDEAGTALGEIDRVVAPAGRPDRADLAAVAVGSRVRQRRGRQHPAHLRGDRADRRGHALDGADGARAVAHGRGAASSRCRASRSPDRRRSAPSAIAASTFPDIRRDARWTAT